jgi:hypothetical protein
LSAQVPANTVSLSWNPASDAETPTGGLSYNLRVGTAPGGFDVVSPEADPNTGFRRLSQLGNAQKRTNAIISNLAWGTKYYWSVQAVDTAFAGSPFASEASFTTPPPPVCTASDVIACPGSTACLTVSATAFGGATITNYSWAGGPTGPNATNWCISLVGFANSGIYGVTVTDSRGAQSTCAASLTVSPNPQCSVSSASVCDGGEACLTVTVTTCGGAVITNYDWVGDPSGPTASAKCFTNATATNSGTYSVTVTDSQGRQATNSGSLAVRSLVVLNTADSGPGSLRQALLDAATPGCNSGPVTFAAGLSGTIVLTNGGLVVGQDQIIMSPGANRLTVDGGGLYTVFAVTNGSVIISGLTIAHGASGIANSATLLVSNCVIAGHTQGGVLNATSGMLTLNQCTIYGNSAGYQYVGAGIYNDASSMLMLTNSTVYGNSALGDSDVALAEGGGIFNYGTAFLSSCTVSGNSCNGGLHGTGEGGGIYNAGTLTLGNTIVAGNGAAAPLGLSSGPDCAGGFLSNGYNLIGETNGSHGWGGTGDLLGSISKPRNALLAPLAYNGGPSPTCALLPGSPAIDAGKSFGVTTDQRGLPRPVDLPYIANATGGDGSDIGAFELSPPVLNIFPYATNVILSWPAIEIGYTLESTPLVANSPSTNIWTIVPGTPAIVGTNFAVTNTTATGRSFYRLRSP